MQPFLTWPDLVSDAHTVAVDLLRPPPGHRLDIVVMTTFRLDLETMLELSLAVLAHRDGGAEDVLADPHAHLEAIREASARVHVFVDPAGIAVPRGTQPLFAMLASSVHPTPAPNGGAFHPKVWVARFLDANDTPLLRVVVLSGDLTIDGSWDVALTSEGHPSALRRHTPSKALVELLRALPGLTSDALPAALAAQVHTIADEAERTLFPSPENYTEPVTFHILGVAPERRTPWRPMSGARVLAIAPFADRTALDTLMHGTRPRRTLVSRQQTLDELPTDALEKWSPILVLCDDPAQAGSPCGLHTKLIGIEHGWNVTWFAGSANLTAAAFMGTNVELMASVTGKKGRPNGVTGVGIDRFTASGFLDRCKPYVRVERRADEALD